MKRATIIFVATLAALIASPALGETIRWAMPTQNDDGTAIPASGETAIKHTEIQIGTCAGTSPNWTFGTVQETLRPLAPIVTQAWNPAVGTYCIRARVQNNANVNSQWSALLRYVKSVPAPGRITITITATVPP